MSLYEVANSKKCFGNAVVMKICADCGKELPEDYEEEQTRKEKESDRLFPVRYECFFYFWKRERDKSGIYLKPKDLIDFFSQEMGKAFVPDRYIDIFQGGASKNILAKHYNPHGISMLKEIYDKANLKI